MADEEQLRILKLGPETWNDWLRQRPHGSVDLSEADLSEAALIDVCLDHADLTGARLWDRQHLRLGRRIVLQRYGLVHVTHPERPKWCGG
jgi:Pentapeptide repeats (8 copies)